MLVTSFHSCLESAARDLSSIAPVITMRYIATQMLHSPTSRLVFMREGYFNHYFNNSLCVQTVRSGLRQTRGRERRDRSANEI